MWRRIFPMSSYHEGPGLPSTSTGDHADGKKRARVAFWEALQQRAGERAGGEIEIEVLDDTDNRVAPAAFSIASELRADGL